MSAKFESGDLKIDFQYVVESMSGEDKKRVLKSLATTEEVISWVCDYICDDDEDGWWHGAASDTRQNFLEKVEQTQLGKTWLSCYWRPWGELRDKLKCIEANRETYTRLHQILRDFDNPLHNLLSKHFDGDECSYYTTKLADGKIREIENLVVEALRSMRKGVQQSEGQKTP